MNSKKLIGTILGVIAFIALIAGATFAWLTGSFTANSNTYNGKTKNFIFNFVGGTEIKGLVQLSQANTLKTKITSATSAATQNDAWAAITASKTANDAAASSFKLFLNVTANTFTTNSVVWAVCKGDCPSTALITAINTGSSTATCASGVVACGVVPHTTTSGSIEMYNDTTTFDTEDSANQTYNVYFWLDGPTIVDADAGANFGAYISASARQ